MTDLPDAQALAEHLRNRPCFHPVGRCTRKPNDNRHCVPCTTDHLRSLVSHTLEIAAALAKGSVAQEIRKLKGEAKNG